MSKLFQKTYKKNPNIILILGILFLISTYFINQKTGNFVETIFPSTQTNNDLLFMLLPFVPKVKYTADIIVLVVSTYTLFTISKNLTALLSYIYSLSIGLMTRAILITLTPLAQPSIIHNNFGLFKFTPPTGAFPSGHTITVFMSYLIFRSTNNPVKKAVFLLLLAEITTLIISHTHYSIDIVGGLMVAYLSLKAVDKYLPFHQQKTTL